MAGDDIPHGGERTTFQRKTDGMRKVLKNAGIEIQYIHDMAKRVMNDSSTLPEFRAMFNSLSRYLQRYESIWDDLVQIYEDEDKGEEFPSPNDAKQRKTVRTLFYEINTINEKINLESERTAIQQPSNITISEPKSSSHLPKINLPHFDGSKITDWPKYRDTFRSLVHEDDTISRTRKFHYLVTSLSGIAYSVISELKVEDANYELAWKALLDTFDKKRVLAATYLNNILSFKPIQGKPTPDGFQQFLSKISDSVSAFKLLNITQPLEFVLFHISIKCLDPLTREQFEIMHKDVEFPTMDDLTKYVRERSLALQLAGTTTLGDPNSISDKTHQPNRLKFYNSKSKSQLKPTLFSSERSGSSSSSKQSVEPPCVICGCQHNLINCLKFHSMSAKQRLDSLTKWKGCKNCLSSAHNTHKCSSKWSCRFCHHRHNSMLHIPTSQQSNDNLSANPLPQRSSVNTETSKPIPPALSSTSQSEIQVLLGTAVVEIQDSRGNFHAIRCVIDSGSHFSFITQKCAQKLGISLARCSKKISGIGQTLFEGIKGQLTCNLRPLKRVSPQLNLDALVVNNITSYLPTVSVPSHIAQHYSKFDLADPKFFEPASVDLLLGGDMFSEIWIGAPIFVGENLPKVFNSVFGMIVIGKYEHVDNSNVYNSNASLFVTQEPDCLTNELSRFWDIEEPVASHTLILSDEERKCEEHFSSTHYRTDNGRYVVKLPFIDQPPDSSNSQYIAMKRFKILENKLERNQDLKIKYIAFMSEYLKLGHMTATNSISRFVIPHHGISKVDRGEVKLRVVFDASVETSSGSLNNSLHVGPKLQNDIRNIILNFRRHPVVFVTDIVKMYRQILIDNEDRTFQHVYWRNDSSQPIQKFELNTLSYGLSCAPYLALRVIRQLCIDEGHRFPKAAEVLLHDSYIDDIASGGSSMEEALDLQTQLINLLNLGGFQLSKWASNRPELLYNISADLNNNTSISLSEKDDNNLKILGLQWDTKCDSFTYVIVPPTIKYTKRSILSTVAKIYDPIGFLSPAVIQMKSIIQDLWKENLDWDQTIPSGIAEKWKCLVDELPHLSKVKIPRFIGILLQYRIVGFADASITAYCAAIYLQCFTSTGIHSHLVIAKTKLAPVKQISIPRLELCAALLLSRLYESISHFLASLSGDTLPARFFSDSSIVLGWIHTPSYRLKTFVSNRITEINQLTPASSWRHVLSQMNPADCGSRGLLAHQLVNFELWWTGPPWLCLPEEEWPSSRFDIPTELPELSNKGVSLTTSVNHPHFIKWISRFSSYLKLLRAIAWMKRQVQNVKKSKTGCSDKTSHFTVPELNEALTVCIKQTQLYYFFDGDLRFAERAISKFSKLHPFFDKGGILRVGGRLRHSNLNWDHKHPILLPADAHLTRIVIDHYHHLYLHPGPNALQALIQMKFWVPSLRRVIRQRNFYCLKCYKAKAKGLTPIMGDLPPCRLQGGRAFLNVGVDFAGPFIIRDSLRRKAQQSKAYLCLFVCMASKALHLEVVSSLTTEAFLATLSRFIARRGLPSEIFSDCGTNFVGASHKIRECFEWFNESSTTDAIDQFSTNRGIQWNFNPPHTPHFGGLWEAGVKSSKSLLHRIAGDSILTFEEITTVFAKIEAILNSRPLCPLSNSPEESDFLSPGHFLVGRPLVAIPQPSLEQVRDNLLSRWQLVKKIEDSFWSRWRREYLSVLQARVKWHRPSTNLEVGDLVLIKGDTNVLQWPLARVTQVHPGRDNVVRVATVRTPTTSYKRPATKLVPLLPLKSSPFPMTQ